MARASGGIRPWGLARLRLRIVLLWRGWPGCCPSWLGQSRENFGHLSGSLALAENHLGHALAEGTMVVDLGEAEVFEREMAETLHGFVGDSFLERTW